MLGRLNRKVIRQFNTSTVINLSIIRIIEYSIKVKYGLNPLPLTHAAQEWALKLIFVRIFTVVLSIRVVS
jgi:hypothetical protein